MRPISRLEMMKMKEIRGKDNGMLLVRARDHERTAVAAPLDGKSWWEDFSTADVDKGSSQDHNEAGGAVTDDEGGRWGKRV